MPSRQEKAKKIDHLRYTEYYDMQKVFDELYEKARNGEKFNSLMDIILSRENILLAYRTIKTNTGSHTAGTDEKTIKDIQNLSAEEVVEKIRFIMVGSEHGYRPKPVRRKDIPKPNGKTRPLGIPCIWDRLVQQCIKQVLEPICEANFSNNSYGFRPNRSVENAIAATYKLLNRSHMSYVVEVDIEGFFDNVRYAKTKLKPMERRVRGNSHARCGVGERPEIVSGAYLSLFFNSITQYDRKERKSRKEIEEMRRLLFVSATRARDELVITAQFCSTESKNGAPVFNMFLQDAFKAAEKKFSPVAY